MTLIFYSQIAKYFSYFIAVRVIDIYHLIMRIESPGTPDTVTYIVWIADVESFIAISYKYVLPIHSTLWWFKCGVIEELC